jgi:hypothetical protein
VAAVTRRSRTDGSGVVEVVAVPTVASAVLGAPVMAAAVGTGPRITVIRSPSR